MQVRTNAPVKYCPNMDPAPLVDGFVVPPLPPEVEPPLAVVVVTPPGPVTGLEQKHHLEVKGSNPSNYELSMDPMLKQV